MEDSTEKLFTISSSGLDVYLGCPRRYHLKYTAGISEPETKQKTSMEWLGANERGTLIHRVMELYVNEALLPVSEKLGTEEIPHLSDREKQAVDKLNSLEPDDGQFLCAWEQAVREIEEEMRKHSYEATVVPLPAKEMELEEIRRICRDAIDSLYERMKADHQYPVMTEKKFGLQRDGSGEEMILTEDGKEEFGICGSIDRVDYDAGSGTYVVIDYKTGNIEKKRQLRTGTRDDLLQDRMYALALEKMEPGKQVTAGRYIFPSSGNEEIYGEMTDEGKEAFRKRLWDSVEKIRFHRDKVCRNDKMQYPDWEETCKYCGYAELCEACDSLEHSDDSEVAE